LNGTFGTDAFSAWFPEPIHLTVLAALVAGWMWMRAVRASGERASVAAEAVVAGYLGAIAGGRLLGLPIDFAHGRPVFSGLAAFFSGEFVAYGSMIGAFAAIAVLLRIRRAPMLPYLDALAPAFGVGIALARVGCFLNGCDYGLRTSLPWSVRFPAGSGPFRDQVAARAIDAGAALSAPVHPTQLYHALSGLAVFAISTWALRRPHRRGAVFALAAGAYAAMRFGIEFLRGDVDRGLYAGLSTSQWIGLGVLALLATLAFVRSRHAARAATPVAEA
ncbi:MAG: prolipoprotein diacylglyceryl transferase, partial [Myxococcales bacterium]|nr:prolipoprotein diacylglyceryl transferase [Myxococcales bacterium]